MILKCACGKPREIPDSDLERLRAVGGGDHFYYTCGDCSLGAGEYVFPFKPGPVRLEAKDE